MVNAAKGVGSPASQLAYKDLYAAIVTLIPETIKLVVMRQVSSVIF